MTTVDLERSPLQRMSPARDLPPGTDVSAPTTHEVSLIAIVNVLLRHRRSIFFAALGGMLLAVVVTRLRPKTFTTSVTFVPQAPATTSTGGFSMLAAQFGFASSAAQGPTFYAAVLTSNEVLIPLSQRTYTMPQRGDTVRGDLTTLLPLPRSLPVLLHLAHESYPGRLQKTLNYLKSDVLTIEPNVGTNTLAVTVVTRSPQLSLELGEQIVTLLNDFNTRLRQQGASAERLYLESRATVTGDDLRVSEDAMQAFLERNRAYLTDPQLRFQADRLQRDLTLKGSVYNGVVQALEQARLAEARNTPTLVVVDHPRPALTPNPSGLLLNVLAGLALGGLLAMIVAFVREFLSRQVRRNSNELEEFASLRRQSAADLKRLFYPVAAVSTRLVNGWRRRAA
jgi:hypothetical protein